MDLGSAPRNPTPTPPFRLDKSQKKKPDDEEGSIGSVPTTPNTSAKASRYTWEPYCDTNWCTYTSSAKRVAHFRKSIAMEMGGVLRYFSKVPGSRVDSTPLSQ